MGTRGLIMVSGSDVVLFRHWDSYPEAVLKDLAPIVAEFTRLRGHEPDMLMANIVQKLRNNHEKDGVDWLGYRLYSLTEAQGIVDTEYLYEVLEDGSISVKRGSGERLLKGGTL